LRIYLDTNVLFKERWPVLGAKLRGMLNLARALNLSVVIPDAVEREVKAHWFLELTKRRKKLQSDEATFLDMLNDVREADSQCDWIDIGAVEKDYDRRIERIRADWCIGSAPFDLVPIHVLFRMAVLKDPPFEERGTGFQDAVILLSVIDDLSCFPETPGVLISNDGIFSDSRIQDLIKRSSANLAIYRSVEDFIAFLKGTLKDYVRQDWDEEDRKAAAALYGQKDAIEDFVRERLNVEPSLLSAQMNTSEFEVRSVELQEITGVFTPQPHREQAVREFEIAASMRCLIRVGPPKGATSLERFIFGPEKVIITSIELEAAVEEKNSDYTITRLLRARPPYEPFAEIT
jgi:hypothetical protein